MKKIISTSLLFTLMLLLGCSSHGTKQSIAEENIKLYSRTWDEIVNKGNIKLFDTDFAPNVTFDNVTTHLQGIDDVKKYFGANLTKPGFIEKKS